MSRDSRAKARILVIDDQEANVFLLQDILRQAGYDSVHGLTDPRLTVDAYRDHDPDLILLDLHMPSLDGFDVMRMLRPLIPETDFLPILILTGDTTSDVRRRALGEGATDFLTKPFDLVEVVLRIRNLLRTRALHLAQRRQNEELERGVRERTLELERASYDTVERLALFAEYRDDLTHRHTRRVGTVSALLARALDLDENWIELLSLAAPLHDLGKIAIPDRILLKPGPLTEDEFEEMKRHTEIGARILAGGASALIRLGAEIARTHHERWDGRGYVGLKGEEIPISGRIVTVADVFDALTHERPYKTAWSCERALAHIRSERGAMFEPRIVDAFVELCRARDLVEPLQAG